MHQEHILNLNNQYKQSFGWNDEIESLQSLDENGEFNHSDNGKEYNWRHLEFYNCTDPIWDKNTEETGSKLPRRYRYSNGEYHYTLGDKMFIGGNTRNFNQCLEQIPR